MSRSSWQTYPYGVSVAYGGVVKQDEYFRDNLDQQEVVEAEGNVARFVIQQWNLHPHLGSGKLLPSEDRTLTYPALKDCLMFRANTLRRGVKTHVHTVRMRKENTNPVNMTAISKIRTMPLEPTVAVHSW